MKAKVRVSVPPYHRPSVASSQRLVQNCFSLIALFVNCCDSVDLLIPETIRIFVPHPGYPGRRDDLLP